MSRTYLSILTFFFFFLLACEQKSDGQTNTLNGQDEGLELEENVIPVDTTTVIETIEIEEEEVEID
jgi:hypothetical protein